MSVSNNHFQKDHFLFERERFSYQISDLYGKKFLFEQIQESLKIFLKEKDKN